MKKLRVKIIGISAISLMFLLFLMRNISSREIAKVDADNYIVLNKEISETNNIAPQWASWFAETFVDGLAEDCKDPTADNYSKLADSWIYLTSEIWPYIDTDSKEYLRNATRSDADSNISKFCELYDHIIMRYDIEDFVRRFQSSQSAISKSTISDNNNEIASLVLVVTAIFSVTLIGSISFLKAKIKN